MQVFLGSWRIGGSWCHPGWWLNFPLQDEHLVPFHGKMPLNLNSVYTHLPKNWWIWLTVWKWWRHSSYEKNVVGKLVRAYNLWPFSEQQPLKNVSLGAWQLVYMEIPKFNRNLYNIPPSKCLIFYFGMYESIESLGPRQAESLSMHPKTKSLFGRDTVEHGPWMKIYYPLKKGSFPIERYVSQRSTWNDFDLQEGDILIFPSFAIHKAFGDFETYLRVEGQVDDDDDDDDDDAFGSWFTTQVEKRYCTFSSIHRLFIGTHNPLAATCYTLEV